jgi:signal transduction histidine kinase
MAEHPPLLAEKLGFFGAITASLSHELKNVLATINELSGLMEDQIQVASAERPLQPERVGRACASINKQVSRGSTLIERLNHFAHSVDDPLVRIEPRTLLIELCDICDRFAKLREVTLERRLSEQPLTLELDPFALQQAVYLGIWHALQAATERRVITVVLETTGGCEIAVESGDPLSEQGPLLEQSLLMQQLVSDLGAELSLRGDRIVLRWP